MHEHVAVTHEVAVELRDFEVVDRREFGAAAPQLGAESRCRRPLGRPQGLSAERVGANPARALHPEQVTARNREVLGRDMPDRELEIDHGYPRRAVGIHYRTERDRTGR